MLRFVVNLVRWISARLALRLLVSGPGRTSVEVGFRMVTVFGQERDNLPEEETLQAGIQLARAALMSLVLLYPINQRAAAQLFYHDRWYDRITVLDRVVRSRNKTQPDLVIIGACRYKGPWEHRGQPYYLMHLDAYYPNGAKLDEIDLMIDYPASAAEVGRQVATAIARLIITARNQPMPPRPEFKYDPSEWPYKEHAEAVR